MRRANVALIVLDTLRYDHLWRAFERGPLCPHLSEFAAGATSFENAISPAAFTAPSHASMFTGLLPCDHGIYTYEQVVGARPPEGDLIASLRSAGYVCVALSANPFILRGTALGSEFDVMVNVLSLTRAGPLAHDEPPLMKLKRRLAAALRPLVRAAGRETMEPSCSRALVQARKMLRAVRTVLRAVRGRWADRPVFLFCNLMATHDPYLFEPQDARFTRPGGRRGADVVPRRFQPDYWLDVLGIKPMSEEMLERLRWSYAASVHYADRMTGEILSGIDGSLADETTNVVVTSDHGELLGERGFFGHGVFLYEPLVHVPLLVRCGELGAGVRVRTPVQTHWMRSLILHWAGVQDGADHPAGSGSLLEVTAGMAGERPMYSFSDPDGELHRFRMALRAAADLGWTPSHVRPKATDAHLQAVRLGDDVLIRTCSGYDLALRMENGADEIELSGQEADGTRRALGGHLLPMKSQPKAAVEHASRDGRVIESLRQLGYID